VLILAGMAVQGRAIDWAANHHNHHAFPAMAYHGMTWRQFDLTALIIRARRSQGPLATNASCSSRHASSIADAAVHFNR
jgi:fatty-acid desaturase